MERDSAGDEKAVDIYNHVKHCTTHPKFLHSNSTSHRWVFGAIAELIDNAMDPDVSASQFCIDMKEFHGLPCLVFMDNGCGLIPEKLHKMLSFGHSKKQTSLGDRSIGKHGNGFKSGTMRLGKDVLVLTKCPVSMTAGFLSQTFLAASGAGDILIPQVSWDLNGNRLSPYDLEVEESLSAICRYSIFPDEESLLAQADTIPVTGTILIISGLREHEGVLELDFNTDPNDIRIASAINSSHFQQLRPNQPNTTEVPMDYSLRAYVAILYKVPRMQVFLRDKKVKTKRIAGTLSLKETDYYKPVGVAEQIKIELGFNTENKNLYGMMLYHRNRLIKAYMRVGMQLEENERGMGVIGLAEADFLQPTHNKQDFDDTTAYRRLLKKLSDVLAEYWWEKKERVPGPQPQLEFQACRPANASTLEDVPDVIWVQCDKPICLKWRILPPGTDISTLPDIWYCEYHPDEKYRVHDEPEQEWDPSARHEIIERRKERKREYDREKKEREAERKRQRLGAAGKNTQELLIKEREALEKEVQVQAARGELAEKEYAALLAEKSEILRKHKETMRELEKAQTELSRKEKEKEDAADSSTQQVESEEPEEGLCTRIASANGHVAEDRFTSSNRDISSQQAIRCNGDVNGAAASGTPSRNTSGSSRRSGGTVSKATFQRPREVQASQPPVTQTSYFPQRQLTARGISSGDPQQSQRKVRDLPIMLPSHKAIGSSSVQGNNAAGLHGSTAAEPRKRRRLSKGYMGSQQATGAVVASSTQERQSNRHNRNIGGEALPCAATPVPPTPPPSCPPSLSPSLNLASLEAPRASLAPTQQLCALNQQYHTSLGSDHESSLSAADPAQLSLAENGCAPIELRCLDIFPEEEVEHSPESHQNMGNGQVVSPDNGASSDSRLVLPQAQSCENLGSGTLSVHLPMDLTVPMSDSRNETELAQAFFKLQRQFRLMTNTMRKMGGLGDSDLVELDGLPTENGEVIALCEKATQHVETMMQNNRQEVAKLKAELAYLMADKMQHGRGEQSLNFKIQNIANQWGIGVDVSK